MAFLKNLGNQLQQQFGDKYTTNEVTPRNLSTPDPNDPNKILNFGFLGNYAKNVDQKLQRSYVENGYIRNVRARKRETVIQDPTATVLIKKRMFSSLIENYRGEYMDEAEKLFMKASAKLFESKCQAIALYEKLMKLDQVVEEQGILDSNLVPVFITLIESLSLTGAASLLGIENDSIQEILLRLKQINEYSKSNNFTSWITFNENYFTNVTGIGAGTGVMEFGSFASLNTTVSIGSGGGSCTINFEDPYNLMRISEQDIDAAIADSVSTKSNNFYAQSERSLANATENLKLKLQRLRLTRGASDLTIRISEDTLLYKRLSVFVNRTGSEILFSFNNGDNFGDFILRQISIGMNVEFDESALFSNSNPEGLNENEKNILSKILTNTLELIDIRKRRELSLDQIEVEDKDLKDRIDYVLRQMRLHYLGKSIIQNMDVVHVYISSKTETIGDYGNSLSENGNLLTQINNNIGNFKSELNDLWSLFSPVKTSYQEIEKNAIVGPNFPDWLWYLIRNEVTYTDSGVHVFAGIVNNVSSSYSGGKYTLSVGCADNMHYFDMGQTNFKPSADVYNKGLYDPLTPFNLQFSDISGLDNGELPDLLPENKQLLLQKIVKAKAGRNRGITYNQDLYNGFDGTPSSNSVATKYIRTLYDPDGFVYRWKKGIGTVLVFDPKSQQRFGTNISSQALVSDPWAGQDLMNAVSILITGYPYNFNNFVKGAIANSNLGVDTQFNEETASYYYRSLISDLRKNNLVWGNFLPFKSLVLNEKALSFLLTTQVEVTQANARITSLLDKISAFEDQLFAQEVTQPPALDQNNNPIPTLENKVKDFKKQLNNDVGNLYRQLNRENEELQKKLDNPSLEGGIQIFGDDASFDPDYDPSSDKITPKEKQRERMELRKNLLLLSQRRMWQVKANEDKNYFIVDDQYDKNYDLQAFSRALTNLDTFKSEYASVRQKIEDALSTNLGLEVFADSQGNIRAQPPGYNKVPSSVYYQMLIDRDKGKRIYPKELENIFFEKNKTLTKDIEIIEDKIRLYLTALGATSDSDRENILNGSRFNTLSNSFTFKFVTDEFLGKFALSQNTSAVVNQSSPDLKLRYEEQPLKKVIDTQIKSKGLFDFVKKSQVFQNSSNSGLQLTVTESLKKSYDSIRRRIQINTGITEPSIDTLTSSNGVSQTVLFKGSKFLDVLNKVSALVSERQSVLKQLDSNLKNIDQSKAINNNSKSAKSVLLPNLFSKQEIPELISHMIEDESVDDLGPGSGKRYVLRDHQIKSFTLKEVPPQYTHIEVNGRFAEGLVSADLGVGVNGNELSTAFAVDYDLWRMYGFKSGGSIPAPYLSDPVSQLAPFATYLLNRARRNILQASCSIVGNEFMQVGETIYVESYNLLFYVESVSHSFGHGSDFTTELTLTYGHPIGEYIPTVLDIVGKGLYSKSFSSNAIQNDRSNNADGSQSIGILTIDNVVQVGNNETITNGDPVLLLMSGTYGKQNTETLKRVFTLFSANINASTRPVLNARIYYGKSFQDGETLYPEYSKPNQELEKIANAIYAWLSSPAEIINNKKVSITGKGPMGNSQQQGLQLDITQFKVQIVEANDGASPSAKAHARSREIDGSGNIAALFNNIIDLWVTFEDKPSENDTSPKSPSESSAQIEENMNTALKNLGG